MIWIAALLADLRKRLSFSDHLQAAIDRHERAANDLDAAVKEVLRR